MSNEVSVCTPTERFMLSSKQRVISWKSSSRADLRDSVRSRAGSMFVMRSNVAGSMGGVGADSTHFFRYW